MSDKSEKAEQALALRGEPVMWGIEINGLVSSAEFHKSFAEQKIELANNTNTRWNAKLVPLYAAPISGERDGK